MTDPEVRIWALEWAQSLPDVPRGTAALVHTAEPIADWLLGFKSAVQAFPREGKEVTDVIPVGDSRLDGEVVLTEALPFRVCNNGGELEQGSLSAVALDDNIGHKDSAGLCDNASVGEGGQAGKCLAAEPPSLSGVTVPHPDTASARPDASPGCPSGRRRAGLV